MSQPCSRDAPPLTLRTWDPSADDMDRLRQDLRRLIGVQSTRCCMPGRVLKTLDGARIQVVGTIRIGGKKALYLNALTSDYVEDYVEFSTKAIKVCDGGERFWGALYDPEDGTFSELAFNGEA